MPHGTQSSDHHESREINSDAKRRTKSGRLSVAVAIERQTDKESSSYRTAVQALLADFINLYKDRERRE